MSNQPSTTPATKPQPVVVYGAIISGLGLLVAGLQTIFKDNPTVVLVLAVIALVVSAASAVKDQIVKGQVVPLADVAAFVNVDRQLVTGPASTAVVESAVLSSKSVPLGAGTGAGTVDDPADPSDWYGPDGQPTIPPALAADPDPIPGA